VITLGSNLPGVRKCPFCAEEIKSEAIKCRHCGSDLTKDTPSAEGTELKLSIDREARNLEKTLASYERFISEQTIRASNATRTRNWAWVWFAAGVILIPFIVGIVIAPIALLTAWRRGWHKRDADFSIVEALKEVEQIKRRLVEIKSEVGMSPSAASIKSRAPIAVPQFSTQEMRKPIINRNILYAALGVIGLLIVIAFLDR